MCEDVSEYPDMVKYVPNELKTARNVEHCSRLNVPWMILNMFQIGLKRRKCEEAVEKIT